MAKIITAKEAAGLFKDGDVVASSCFGLAGWPEEIAFAVADRYRKKKHPKGITFMHAAGVGDWKSRGGGVWAEEGTEGLVKRVVTGHIGSEPQMVKFVQEKKIECYFWPLGCMCQWYSEVARRSPGLFTKTGLGTFLDPRFDGLEVNGLSQDRYIKVVEVEGEEWLFFKTFPINVALIRGTTADEKGNITFEKEAISLEALPVALAVKASGGTVIVQVERLARAESLHPQHVKVPGVCVDYVVMAEKPQMQTMGTQYKAALAGHIKVPDTTVPPMPLDERKIIARRAAMELIPGPVNLGIGIPQGIGTVVAEEGCSEMMTLISESGNIGGIPGATIEFGAHYNGEAMLQQDHLFNWFDGGGLLVAMAGLSQTDPEGNLNAGTFGGRPMGPGGFINTTTHAKKVVFCGTFTAGPFSVKADNGRLIILKEGPIRKFVKKVEQVGFSGTYAMKTGKQVLFVTERAVFELTKKGLVLTEIAPGVDLEKDVLAHMEFKPIMAPTLKLMPAGIFKPVWGQLKEILQGQEMGRGQRRRISYVAEV
jgi:propionate CoA-transferase